MEKKKRKKKEKKKKENKMKLALLPRSNLQYAPPTNAYPKTRHFDSFRKTKKKTEQKRKKLKTKGSR
jgi:hypothetical protein